MMAQRWLVATALLVALSGCGDDTRPATVPAPATSSAAPTSSAPAVAAGRTRPAPAVTGAPRTAGPGPSPSRRAAKPRIVALETSGFVAAVQNRLPEVAVDHRDEEIAAIAGQACTSLAAGDRARAIVAGTERFGTDEATAHTLIRMAIDKVCPDQDRRIEEF